MGFLDKLKAKGAGVVTSVPPAEGVEPASIDEVRSKLLAIEGRGVEAMAEGDEVVVAWMAKVASAGSGSAAYEHRYRAIRVELDPGDSVAKGLCLKKDTEGAIDASGLLSGSKGWERGQHVGSETMHVVAWLGPHHTEGGADERGYNFRWGELRGQVIEAVTGAGWTYKPKRV